MYNFLLGNPQPSKTEIENCLDGNICRCTGYRSILDAWQSFSADEKPIDIEELYTLKCLNGSNKKCDSELKKKIHIINGDQEWYYPKSLLDLFDLLVQYQSVPYKIVSGGTGVGVFKLDGPFNVFIDIKSIPDFYIISRQEQSLSLGSMTPLAKLISVCNDFSSNSGFEYLKEITSHWNRIANRHVRSVGTWAGNLMMKYYHSEFPSDLFITLETVNAKILVIGPEKDTPPLLVSPANLLTTQLRGRTLYSVSFQPFDKQTTFIKTYKISIRPQNAHAYVNAGFRFEINPSNFQVKSLPTIVFGGISSQFVHATKTEQFLMGKNLNDPDALETAFNILKNEIVPDNDPVSADPNYRRTLACSLMYKFILFVNKDKINTRLLSAIDSLVDSRQLSSGIETYSDNPDYYPVTKKMTKLNAILQASGTDSLSDIC